ncbi:MAG: glycoside hydrolase family 31 protein [Flavobacteriales bacterium]|nr:glycoside hydrolase family 31 protein [Flavobacteriales bacterium]
MYKPVILVLFISILILLELGNACAQQVDSAFNPDKSTTPYDLPWPSWVFGHWVWEDESTTESALQIVDDYISREIPVSAIIIDSPWETDYNTFVWDSTLFPNPQAMIDSLHARDVKVLMWITGIINDDVQPLYDYAAGENYFMKTFPFDSDPTVINWWKGDGSLIDYYNPEAVTWWKGLMDQTLALGIDGWKCDGTDFSVIQCPWSDGAGSFVSRLDYSHEYYRLHFDYTREVLGDERVIHARPIDNYGLADIGGEQVSFAPVDMSFAAWVGDQDATFEGLTWALNSMYHSSEMGYLSFGSDIGGYRENDLFPTNGRSKELFIRWAQLGTFSGLMENGGGGEHRPWIFDQETEDIYRDLVQKRYSMLDYLMTNSEIYFSEQRSLMEFFNKTDYSYMLGPDIFVTPFLTEGTSITVSFPDGGPWIYLYDYSQSFDGGTQETLTIPYTEYPVFFRSGTAPLGMENTTWETEIHVYPNPTSDLVYFKLPLERKINIIVISDVAGRTIRTINVIGLKDTTIDLGKLAEGIYHLNFFADDWIATKKVVRY